MIEVNNIPVEAPTKLDVTRLAREPQLSDSNVLRVKSTKVIFTESAYTKGRFIL